MASSSFRDDEYDIIQAEESESFVPFVLTDPQYISQSNLRLNIRKKYDAFPRDDLCITQFGEEDCMLTVTETISCCREYKLLLNETTHEPIWKMKHDRPMFFNDRFVIMHPDSSVTLFTIQKYPKKWIIPCCSSTQDDIEYWSTLLTDGMGSIVLKISLDDDRAVMKLHSPSTVISIAEISPIIHCHNRALVLGYEVTIPCDIDVPVVVAFVVAMIEDNEKRLNNTPL
jgi:hypothetical protein